MRACTLFESCRLRGTAACLTRLRGKTRMRCCHPDPTSSSESKQEYHFVHGRASLVGCSSFLLLVSGSSRYAAGISRRCICWTRSLNQPPASAEVLWPLAKRGLEDLLSVFPQARVPWTFFLLKYESRPVALVWALRPSIKDHKVFCTIFDSPLVGQS